MSRGFQVKNSSNTFQIDDRYSNLFLKHKGVINLPGGSAGNPNSFESSPSISFPSINGFDSPLMCFIPNQYCCIDFEESSIKQAYRQQKGICEYYCFTKEKIKHFDATHGLQVRNPYTLEEVFNSNWAILKVVDVLNLKPDTTGYVYELPANKKCAISIGGGVDRYYRVGMKSNAKSTCFKVVNNRLHIDILETASWYADDDEVSYVASSFNISVLIIDVTGY
ncbi:hypothetical protein AAH235_003948 [Providencia stuartii]|uniref:hypothetical protein n=1 Tax=Providencia stuartii TaxID=588 RepID=UPI00069E9744|nr:hypothetical protein [Providencia stuartii]KNZ84836.1 hypothetical protein AFL46_11565 [Providencia stuartii]MTC67691.1 hypothetical protein [Providencia stuartii]SPY68257.1 Uncharacterised protein [Providencia stuartii]SPY68492.1 Uncharacterised protein [Providencia stuartii]SPY68635.1 Uncharacterised protein [Providencia stuartii]